MNFGPELVKIGKGCHFSGHRTPANQGGIVMARVKSEFCEALGIERKVRASRKWLDDGWHQATPSEDSPSLRMVIQGLGYGLSPVIIFLFVLGAIRIGENLR